MKKISKERKFWLIHHSLRLARRRKKRQRDTHHSCKPKTIILSAPKEMCLATNYELVAEFFERLRNLALKATSHRRLTIDFRPITILTPGAALILAAELDRWRRVKKTNLNPWKLDQWNHTVKRLFFEMGLFNLLGVSKENLKSLDSGPLEFFRFLTGNESTGALADQLMKNMSPVVGRLKNDAFMYIALSEAMTNVVQHAYPEDWNYKLEIVKNQWWVAGSFDKKSKVMNILFYDQGVGIPNTLPISGFIEPCKKYLNKIGCATRHDADLIKAAINSERTRTKQSHRGKGIKQLLDFSQEEDGLIRIISGNGEYIKESVKKDRRIHHATNIGGTFVQWTITLPQEGW